MRSTQEDQNRIKMRAYPANLRHNLTERPSVFITGGSGFVGKAVVEAFSALGWNIFGPRPRPGGSPSGKNVTPLELSSLNQKILERFAIRSCVHLAESPTSGDPAVLSGQYARLSGLLDKGFDNFVYFSSGRVYGTRRNFVLYESCDLSPEDNYSNYKVQAELLVSQFPTAAILRPSNIYGPGCHPASVVAQLLEQANQRPRILRLAQEGATRDFIHVDDVAEAAVRIVDQNVTGLFNVATSRGTSLKHLAATVLKLKGLSETTIEFADPVKHPSHLVMSNSRISNKTSWHPKISLQTGLESMSKDLDPLGD